MVRKEVKTYYYKSIHFCWGKKSTHMSKIVSLEADLGGDLWRKVYEGELSGTTTDREWGQWEKFILDAVTTEVSADPTESSGAGSPIRVSPPWGKRPDLYNITLTRDWMRTIPRKAAWTSGDMASVKWFSSAERFPESFGIGASSQYHWQL